MSSARLYHLYQHVVDGPRQGVGRGLDHLAHRVSSWLLLVSPSGSLFNLLLRLHLEPAPELAVQPDGLRLVDVGGALAGHVAQEVSAVLSPLLPLRAGLVHPQQTPTCVSHVWSVGHLGLRYVVLGPEQTHQSRTVRLFHNLLVDARQAVDVERHEEEDGQQGGGLLSIGGLDEGARPHGFLRL